MRQVFGKNRYHGRDTQHWQEFWGFIVEVWQRFSEDRVHLSAGAISFFTLLSLVPLLLFAVSVAAYFFPSSQVIHDHIASITAAFGPNIARSLEEEIIGPVFEHKGFLTSVASMLGLWTGTQVFIIVESAINQAWSSRRRRPFWMRRLLALLTMLIVGTLTIGAVVMTNLIRLLAGLALPLWGREIGDVPFLITTLVSVVMPTLLIAAIAAAVYRILPTKKVTLRSVLPGAVFAGVLWVVSLHLFGWYVSHLAQYPLIYGSLSSVIMLMIWFYYSAFVFLLGAEISAAYHVRLVEAGDSEEQRVEEQEQVALVEDTLAEVEEQEALLQESLAHYRYSGDGKG